jgi:cell division transport system ATP-binding protein
MIKLENVTKVYPGGTVAVKDINLEVAKGEFVFLVGASGSGKSTLIRLMIREEPPTNGDIWIAGKHASALPSWKVPYLRRSIGTVFQDFKLLPTKTVYENVAFAMEVTAKNRSVIRNQVPQVLKLVGLSDKSDRLPRQLSGGEQQRVAVARAFVNRPLILLADEPTGNLDPGTSVGIMRILDRISRTGTTVVMATHDHAIVDAMQRRVIELDRGRISRDESRGIYETRQPEQSAEAHPTETIEDGQSGDDAELALEEIVEEATEEALADALEQDRIVEDEAQAASDSTADDASDNDDATEDDGAVSDEDKPAAVSDDPSEDDSGDDDGDEAATDDEDEVPG